MDATASDAALSDGGLDAATARTDAAIDAWEPCSGSAPDPLPPLAGQFVLVDATTRIPSQAGGSAIGVWRGELVTIYAATPYDTSASRLSGTAWVVVSRNDVRAAIDLDVAIVTSAGTTSSHEVIEVRGAYLRDGVTLHVTPGCASPELHTTFDIDFTSGDSSGTLRLQVTTTALGAVTMVIRCEHTST